MAELQPQDLRSKVTVEIGRVKVIVLRETNAVLRMIPPSVALEVEQKARSLQGIPILRKNLKRKGKGRGKGKVGQKARALPHMVEAEVADVVWRQDELRAASYVLFIVI